MKIYKISQQTDFDFEIEENVPFTSIEEIIGESDPYDIPSNELLEII